MAGQIIKRGERNYTVRIFMGRDPDTGKRRYLNKTVHGTRKQAEQERIAMLRAKDMGTLVEPVKMSFNTLLDRWLETAAKTRVKERTYRGYKWYAKRYIRPALGDRLLTAVKPYDIEKLYAEMLEQEYSPKTIRHCQNVIHNAYEQAIRWQLASSNPAEHVGLPKKQHREMKAMTEEESQRFLAAAKSDRLYPLFAVLLGVGVRPEEAAGLKWEDFDPMSKQLSVRRAVVRPEGGGWKFEEPKTKHATRTLALSNGLVTGLLEHREDVLPSEHDLMFPNVNGQPLDMNNVRNRNFRTIAKRAGLSGFTLYSLRHTHATLLLLDGVHIKVVSERLGHSSVAITLDIYSHVLPNMQQEAADKLEAILFSALAAEDTRAPRN